MTRTNLFSSLCILLCFSALPLWANSFPPVAADWEKIAGGATDIGIGANGDVWIIGGNANDIYQRNADAWTKIPGGGVRIAVDPSGNAWVANAAGAIYKYDGSSFALVSGRTAKDIAIGANGKVWVIGTEAEGSNFSIYRQDNGTWTKISGSAAVRISVDPAGNAWVVNSSGNVYKFNGTTFQQVAAPLAKDLSIGANGDVWMTGTNSNVYKYTGSGWDQKEGSADFIAVDPLGAPWVLNTNTEIFRWVSNTGTANMKFTNTGTKTVEIYKTNSQGLPGALIATIGNLGTANIPVKLNDQFLVKTPYIATANIGAGAVNDLYSYHPKIVITDLNAPAVIIMGNLPCNEARSTGGVLYQVPDYEPNTSGIDIKTLNPRDLVTSINKARVFEKLNPLSGVDYHTTGNKLIKYGFTYVGLNTSFGSEDMKMAYGYDSFSKDFSMNIGGSVPVKGLQATGSIGFNMTENNERSNESVYTYSRHQKSIFKVLVEPAKARLSPEFISDVLSVNSVSEALSNIVQKYGTHYPTAVIYGGDRSVYHVMKKEEYSSAKGWGIDVKAEVSKSKMGAKETTHKRDGNNDLTGRETKYGDVPVGSGSLDFAYSQSETVKSLMHNTSSKYRMIGGEGNFAAWTVNEATSAPISVEVGSLANLIDIKVFKDGTSPEVLAQKKAFIEQAIAQYLADLMYLNQPLPQPVVYQLELKSLEVTRAVNDDANKGLKGYVNSFFQVEGQEKVLKNLWQQDTWVDPWSILCFCPGKQYHVPNGKTAYFTHFPESNGTFKPLKLNFASEMNEMDDSSITPFGYLTGTKAPVLISNMNPNETREEQFTIFEDGRADWNSILIRYKLQRVPSEFADVVGN